MHSRETKTSAKRGAGEHLGPLEMLGYHLILLSHYAQDWHGDGGDDAGDVKSADSWESERERSDLR